MSEIDYSEYPSPIIVGYTVRALPSYRERLIEPTPPPSYKTDTAISGWLERFWTAFDAAAPFCKMTGELASVFAVDPRNERVFDGSRETLPHLATSFIRWLEQHYCFSDYAKSTHRRPCCFYGFNPKPLLRMAGIGAIREGADPVPVGLWYLNEECLDPKEMLLETEMKAHIGLNKILAEAPGGEIEVPTNYSSHFNATIDAVIAAEICSRYQLIPAEQLVSIETLNLNIEVEAPPVAETKAKKTETAPAAKPDETVPAASGDDDAEYDEAVAAAIPSPKPARKKKAASK